MPQSRDQLYIPGLQQPLLRRMATFPVMLAAIPFNLLKQWIVQNIPSVWLTSLRGLSGNLWASIPAAITTEGISIFGLRVSFFSRPSLALLDSPEPPPSLTEMTILSGSLTISTGGNLYDESPIKHPWIAIAPMSVDADT
ncbi:hypothetical protein NEUTE1DRAFT_108060 [Neurospora tetrasperma FGSC 2508]|uniref:Uncharacterized protein n=1 Tax=Neurospora tetrasperma (strain FGSC 2508 / ATCC MYA-4615 / P0657) TaxID=510951 RepID=F8MED1_NEUT8|nr:uncharacterized protein NEUTE1DRAFT_108060 [Neurospora tetrasperma FGSC 2508]EGO61613.1 hypothetical protein NEUTE1DRAFT_108060 [Neurospora tetrasperma FGSC 2508]EGZ74343.1 hypothetical protein NEUTE2DRAFT_135713 [Neurospora tetrasperma FGSC 2509]